MCNSKKKKKLQTSLSRFYGRAVTAELRAVFPGTVFLILCITSLAPNDCVEAGVPHRRIGSKPRVEGPVVPAPKNWGYRPTRWIRWETDIIHPSLGPISADAKKENKAAETAETAEAVDPQGDIPSSGNQKSAPEPLPDGSALPPLPADDGPPSLPPNLGEDLPPLPGEDFGPPTTPSKQPPTPLRTKPKPPAPPNIRQSPKGPAAGGPTFRDPDTIFNPADASSKPSGTAPQVPETLPEKQDAAANPGTKKPDTAPNLPSDKPTPIPNAPSVPSGAEDTKSTPTKSTPITDPPGPSDKTQWEKRTREKPAPPEIKKEAPNKKPGEPFYDPDSIFDERSARLMHSEANRWQKAGTAKAAPPSTARSDANVQTAPPNEIDSIFSPVRPAAPTPTVRKTDTPRSGPSEAAQSTGNKKASQSTWNASPARPMPKAKGAWKQVRKHPAEPHVDYAVRPASFEVPAPARAATRAIATTQAKPSAAHRPKAAGASKSPPAPVLATPASVPQHGPPQWRSTPEKVSAVSTVSSEQTEKAAPEAPAASEVPRPTRNPMRDPLPEQAGDRVTDDNDNPLRESSVGGGDAATTEDQRANPLR